MMIKIGGGNYNDNDDKDDDDGGGNDVDSDDDFYRTIQSYSTNILTKLITQLFRRN